jgi:hypothetical protein
MRLFFFMLFSLTSFLALGSPHSLINKSVSIPSTMPIDTTKGIIIQHSLPRGDGYNDPAGKNFRYVVFWASVVNKTDTPIELIMNFPADSFAISGNPHGYVKFFLPPDIMTPEKESLYNYGLTDLKSFLDTHFHKATLLKRTIKPKEEYRFYIAAVSNEGYNGAVRAEFVLKEQNLFYKINMLDSLLPCGHIVFKK